MIMKARVYIFGVVPRWWQTASCQTYRLGYLVRWNMVCVVYTPAVSLLQMDMEQKLSY